MFIPDYNVGIFSTVYHLLYTERKLIHLQVLQARQSRKSIFCQILNIISL